MKKTFFSFLILFTMFQINANKNDLQLSQSFNVQRIEDLSFTIYSEDLIINETNDNQILVEVYTNLESRIPKVYQEKEKLVIHGVSNFNVIPSFCKIVVSIPKNTHFEEIDFDIASGKILTDCLNSRQIEIEIASGHFNSKGFITDEIELEVKSGKFECKNIESRQTKIEVKSGSCLIENAKGQKLKAKLSSGSLKLHNLDFAQFDSFNASGTVTMEFINPILNDSRIEVTSGRFNLRLPRDSYFGIDFSSTSGHLQENFGGAKTKINGNYQNTFNGGGPLIRMSLTSGSIHLEEN